jgi:hypothetical protein
MLIRTFMDEVEHNERGNRIMLRKRYSAVERPAATDVGDSDQPSILGHLESAAGV